MCDRNISFARAKLQENPEVRERLAQASSFTEMRANHRQVVIDNVPYYIIEADTLVDEDQLMIYAQSRDQETAYREFAARFGLAAASVAATPSTWLVGMTENEMIVRWQPGQVLTYRIAKSTFTDDDRYDIVRSVMASAARDWEHTCGVQFEHMIELDDLPGTAPEGAIFTVRQINADGAFIAAAFFVNDPVSRRRVLLDESFFTGNDGFDRVGVLRHELGHVLGFRHEHIRSGAPAVCPGEPRADTVDLGAYDPQSVMHYFCGGVGSKELRITATDRIGAQMIYGPPLKTVRFVAA